ncbi:MAG: STAS domain-containing protein [Planctomycetales bacterium]|nr:STAS domain-containing protein [Planctomycetales bacterium]MCA9166471.1 STAS domain-containing protein [Planctomycetales bacterium]
MADYQLIDVETRTNGAVVVTIKETQLSTLINTEMLQSELHSVVKTLQPKILVIDFDQVRLISSSAIGMLLRIRKELIDFGGQLRLCRVSVPVGEIYRVLNLDQTRLLVFDTVEEAVLAQVVESNEVREVWED